MKEKTFEKTWQEVLLLLVERIYEPFTREDLDWVIIGSVATALQGCRITPKDIDIVVKNPIIVHKVSELLKDFTIERSHKNLFKEIEEEGEWWLSSKEMPIFEGKDQWNFHWVFGRWLIDDFRVEFAHITPPEGFIERFDGIWEAGEKIWPHTKKIRYKKYDLPIVPLEIQLETNYGREFDDRIKEILNVFKKKGYNKALLEAALDKRHLAKFTEEFQSK